MTSVASDGDGGDEALVAEAAERIFGESLPVARAYAELLTTAGVERGLLGPREAGRIWSRHILNSTVVAEVVAPGVSVVDVGSGAGLPGIPLALARPDLDVTLLEPLLRRSTFLSEVVEELGLGARVHVVRGRAEEQQQTYDVVTARAVAPLGRLVGWCRPLMRASGLLVALKGSSAAAEVLDAKAELKRARLTARVVEATPYPGAESTSLIVCK